MTALQALNLMVGPPVDWLWLRTKPLIIPTELQEAVSQHSLTVLRINNWEAPLPRHYTANE